MIGALRYLIVEQLIGRERVVEVAELLARGWSPSEVASKLGVKKNFVRSVGQSLVLRGARGAYLTYLSKYIPAVKRIKPVVRRDGYCYECLLCGCRFGGVTSIYLHLENSHGDLVDGLLIETVKFINSASYK